LGRLVNIWEWLKSWMKCLKNGDFLQVYKFSLGAYNLVNTMMYKFEKDFFYKKKLS